MFLQHYIRIFWPGHHILFSCGLFLRKLGRRFKWLCMLMCFFRARGWYWVSSLITHHPPHDPYFWETWSHCVDLSDLELLLPNDGTNECATCSYYFETCFFSEPECSLPDLAHCSASFRNLYVCAVLCLALPVSPGGPSSSPRALK